MSKIEDLLARMNARTEPGCPPDHLVATEDLRALVSLGRVAVAFREAELEASAVEDKRAASYADMAEIERVLGRVAPAEHRADCSCGACLDPTIDVRYAVTGEPIALVGENDARELAAWLDATMRSCLSKLADPFAVVGNGAGTTCSLRSARRLQKSGLIVIARGYASDGRGRYVERTDLGRAVARVLASQEVDRG